jgi:CHAT domain-containing protein
LKNFAGFEVMDFMKTKVRMLAVLIGAIAPLAMIPGLARSSTVSPTTVAQTLTSGALKDVKCLKKQGADLSSSPIRITIRNGNLDDLMCLQEVVKTLIDQQDDKAAIPFADLALQLFEKNFTDRRKEFSVSLRHRAFLYEVEGQDQKAEEFYWKALNVLNIVGIQTRTQITPSASEEVKVEISPKEFKTRVDNQEFWNKILILSAKETKQQLPDGKILAKQERVIIAFPKDDHKQVVAILLLQLGILYYRQEKYLQSTAIFESLFLYQEDHQPIITHRDGTKTRISRPERELAVLSYLVRSYLNSNKIDRLTRLNLPQRLESPYRLLLRLSSIDDALKNTTPNLTIISILNERTLVSIFSLVYSPIFFASQRNSTQDSSLNSLALSNALVFKNRSIDIQANYLGKACYQDSQTEIQQWCNEVQGTTTQLSNLVYEFQQQNILDKYLQMEKKRSELIRKIQLKSNNYNYDVQGEKILATVQTHIPEKTVLVEIIRYLTPKNQPKVNELFGEWRYAAAVLHPTGVPKWVDLGKASEIEASVAKFRTALSDRDAAQISSTNPKNLVAVQQAGRELDQRVMAKIRPLLGDAKHLLISADGELNLVPFEALRDETGQYLIDRYQFSYLNSGRDLLQIAESRKTSPKPRQDALILANPDYSQPTTPVATTPVNPPQRPNGSLSGGDTASLDSLLPFGRADGTAQLAQTLKSEILPTATVLTQATASKTALQRSPSPRILVLATHGFFITNPEKAITQPGDLRTIRTSIQIENPLLRSGLALAGANRNLDSSPLPNGDNGILTALEVAGLDLRGTQLVVLSACETGNGEAKVGDGVYGLRRALVIAGAQSQVMSLWKVDGVATKDLMVDYFTRMTHKQDPQGRHAALQAAKQAMLKDPQRQHPYYWAGFIASGDWTPLQPK